MMRSIASKNSGFREALLELCIHVDLSDYNTIDLCGQVTERHFQYFYSSLFYNCRSRSKSHKHSNYGFIFWFQ
jgi:anthranilate phosphoribosyltransferase